MRIIDQALKEHFEQETTTLAQYWKITRKDGTVFAYTDHDMSLFIDGVHYKSFHSGTASAYEQGSDGSVGNMDVEFIIDDAGITIEDLTAGLFDSAEIEVGIVNYNDISQRMIIMAGELGEVKIQDEKANVEFRGKSHKLKQTIGRTYTRKEGFPHIPGRDRIMQYPDAK